MTNRRADWLTVLFRKEQAYVVADGTAPKHLKNFDNEFRGAQREEAAQIVGRIRRTGQRSAGQTMSGYPLTSPSGQVVGAQIASHGIRRERPAVGVWEWTPSQGGPNLPPQLRLDHSALDLLGVSPRHRDRSIYGPADFYTRIVRTGDFVRHRKLLQDIDKPGCKYSATVPVISETGHHSRVHTAELSVESTGGNVVNGIVWRAANDSDAVAEETADATLVRSLARQTGMFALVIDSYYALPYVAQWLTQHPPGIAHGVSTGQPPGFVDDDMPKVLAAIETLRSGERDSLHLDVRTRTLQGDELIETSCTCEVLATLAPDRTLSLVTFDTGKP